MNVCRGEGCNRANCNGGYGYHNDSCVSQNDGGVEFVRMCKDWGGLYHTSGGAATHIAPIAG